MDPQFASDEYPVRPILPALRHRSTFRTRLGWVANRMTHYPRREARFLRWLRTRPDIVGVHFQEWTPWLGRRVLPRIRAMGKRVFYTVHNVFPHRYPRWVPRPLVHRWIRRSCMLCDGLFVLTDRLAGELAAFLGKPHPPIHVAPHGVWTVRNRLPAAPPGERLAHKRLLFFGSIRRNKGLDLLLRAMSQLPGYRLTIAGEPDEPEYYRDMVLPLLADARAAGAAIDVRDRFVPDDEVTELFATHSAIVLPYTGGFVAQSGVVFMALAHELPVVASEAGGLPEVFGQFRIGRTFDAFEPAALARAVRDLHDGGDADAIGEAIRAAKRRFSWHEAAAATIDGYATAIERRVDRDTCPIEAAHAV
jgi:glycosyltransferase involved in cell wall biosynthesis